MKYNGGDNNNGITIFDITNLEDVRYCFVDFYGMESNREVQLMTPLNARTYVGAYYALNDSENDWILPTIEELRHWSLIETESLEATWPGEGWEQPHDADNADNLSDDEQNHPEDHKQLSDLANVPSSTLRTNTLGQVVEMLINSDSIDDQILSEAEVLADFWPRVAQGLYDRAGNLPYTTAVRRLLSTSLAERSYVDLGPFKMFTFEDILDAIAAISRTDTPFQLNLSGRKDLTTKHVRSLLTLMPQLKSLYIMDSSTPSAADLAELKPLCDLYHDELLKRPILVSDRRDTEQPPALDFSTPASPVTQVLIVHLGRDDPETFTQLQKEAVKWGTLKQHERRLMSGLGDGFEYHGPIVSRKLAISDVPLPLSRLLPGLRNLCTWIRFTDEGSVSSFSQCVSESLALGDIYCPGPEVGVGPLSTELMLLNGTQLQPRDLAHSRWAIVLLVPRIGLGMRGKLMNVYYALVKRDENGQKFAVCDMPSFLKAIGTDESARIEEWWKQQDDLDFLHFYDRPDI